LVTVTDLTSEVTMVAISPGEVTNETTTTSITSSGQSPRPSQIIQNPSDQPPAKPGSPKPFGTSRNITSRMSDFSSKFKKIGFTIIINSFHHSYRPVNPDNVCRTLFK
jgi:hypothetical protein